MALFFRGKYIIESSPAAGHHTYLFLINKTLKKMRTTQSVSVVTLLHLSTMAIAFSRMPVVKIGTRARLFFHFFAHNLRIACNNSIMP